VDGKKIGRGYFGVFEKNEELAVFKGLEKGNQLLFLSGKPLNEPIIQYGPFVMNTKEEINQAYEDYQNGRFIRNKPIIISKAEHNTAYKPE
jgi:quercetin 2,3-dioxygenase